jgi:hypothetical protein
MMRLTLRSGKDGRFLARIVESGNTHPFVLDFGDRRIIDDVQQRLLKGFTMWRFGTLVQATPQDPELLFLLAEFYCGEGLLVAFEEPTWPGREATLDERIPVPAADRELFGTPADTLKTVTDDRIEDRSDSTEERPDSTELVELEEMTDLGKFLEDTKSDAIEDAQTEFIDVEDAGTEIAPKPPTGGRRKAKKP